MVDLVAWLMAADATARFAWGCYGARQVRARACTQGMYVMHLQCMHALSTFSVCHRCM